MNDNFVVQFTALAIDDLRGIFNYISFTLENPESAEKIVKRIREKLFDLSHNPEGYPLVSIKKLEEYEVHKIIIGNYISFFRVDNNSKKVIILRIVYGKRNLETMIV